MSDLARDNLIDEIMQFALGDLVTWSEPLPLRNIGPAYPEEFKKFTEMLEAFKADLRTHLRMLTLHELQNDFPHTTTPAFNLLFDTFGRAGHLARRLARLKKKRPMDYVGGWAIQGREVDQPHWRSMARYSLAEAAMLSLGRDPRKTTFAAVMKHYGRSAQNGRPVMIGFNRRFDPNFSALKAALDKGEIGKAELLSITSFDPAPPPVAYIKVSGGLFRDMMIHDFDMANFIMGAAPVSVSAVGTSIVDPAIGDAGDVDTAVVTLTYADGRIAVIKNSRRAVYGYDQRVELLGSEGLLQAQNMLENTVVKSTTAGVTGAKPTYFFLERYMPAYAAEWAAFVTAVATGAVLPVTLADGVAALAMAEAATLSVKSGQPVLLANLLG